MSKPAVASGIDDTYVYPYLISIASIHFETKAEITFILAYDKTLLSTESREIIGEFTSSLGIEINFVEITLPDGLPSSGYISAMAFSRLLLADIFPSEFVWVDADTVCINTIDQLLNNLPLTENALLSARPDLKFEEEWSPNLARKVAGEDYFNSGVMKINCKLWRDSNFPIKWKNALSNYDDYNFELSDQCILNFLTRGVSDSLPKKYNVLVAQERFLPDDCILHYAGATKPWKNSLLPLELAEILLSPSHFTYMQAEISFIERLRERPDLQEKLHLVRARQAPRENAHLQKRVSRKLGLIYRWIELKREWRSVKHRTKEYLKTKLIPIDARNIDFLQRQLSLQIANEFDYTVRYGPFKGLHLSRNMNWSSSDVAPMVLGIYEYPILNYITRLTSKIENFINLGAGDGYYVAGMVKNGYAKQAFAYEISEIGRSVISESIKLNRIDEDVQVRGAANSSFVKDFTQSQLDTALILIDIEGNEFELFEDLDMEALASSQIIIEIHDWLDKSDEKVSMLVTRLLDTHDVRVLTTGPRDLDEIVELRTFSDLDRWILVSENRPKIMKWLCCSPK